MTTVQTLASEMTSAFETRTRSNGDTFYALRDGSPEWMSNVCHTAHNNGGILPMTGGIRSCTTP